MDKRRVGTVVAVAVAILLACGVVFYAMRPQAGKGFLRSFFNKTISTDDARDNLESLIKDSNQLAIDDISIIGNTLVVSVSETSFIDAQTSLNLATQTASDLVRSFEENMATEYVTWIEKNDQGEVNAAYTIKSEDVVADDVAPEEVLNKAKSYSLSPDVHRVVIKFVPDQNKGEVKDKDSETVEVKDDDTNSPWSRVMLTHTYRTQATKLGDTPVKQLEFSYPDGWEVKYHYLNDGANLADETFSISATDHSAIVFTNRNEDNPRMKTNAIVEKICDSSLYQFESNGSAKLEDTYMIAKVSPNYGTEYFNPKRLEIALIPEMPDGIAEFNTSQAGGLSFKYDVQLQFDAIYLDNANEQTINEAIAILKSLHAVEDTEQTD